MYRWQPRRMFVTDWAMSDERNVERMERMVRGLGRSPSEVQVISAEQMPDVIRSSGWIGEVRQGAYANASDPDVVFSASKWMTAAERGALAKTDLFKRCIDAYRAYGDCKQWFTGSRTRALFGASPFYHFEKRDVWKEDLVCWSLHDLHSAWGCLHRCDYCQRDRCT